MSALTVTTIHLLLGTAAVLRAGAESSVLDVGSENHLFLDYRYIESASNVRVVQIKPELPRENLIPRDKPWEAFSMGAYSSILEYGGEYRLYYSAYDDSSFKACRMCMARSKDGVHWEKPNLGVVEYKGSKENNIVAIAMVSQVFIDPFDDEARRYKMLTIGDRQDYANPWRPLSGTNRDHIYLLYSRDGIQWQRMELPVLPFYVGAPIGVLWDDSIERWAIYPRGYARRGDNGRLFNRLVVGRNDLATAYPFRPVTDRRPEGNGGYHALHDEIPVVLGTDRRDPIGAQIYTMHPYKYASDAYVAFPSVWFSRSKWFDDQIDLEASNTLEIQLAISRDGVLWQRPWRSAIVPVGPAGSGSEGQIYASGMVKHDDRIYLYYAAQSLKHLDDYTKPFQESIRRAVWRLDGFTAVDAPPEGGEFTTPLLRYSGNRLQLNAQIDGGGFIKVEMLDNEGYPVDGHTYADSRRLQGDSLAHIVDWVAGSNVSAHSTKAVRLRFVMRSAKLYSMRFIP